MIRSNIAMTGLPGLLAAVLTGTGEFILHYDALARFGTDFGHPTDSVFCKPVLGRLDSCVWNGHYWALEISGREVCPGSSGGVPACYYSLAASIGLLASFKITKRVRTDE